MTVYVVDDVIDAADSLVQLLMAMGHDARAFYNAESLWKAVQQETPDCVMLDIAMAGTNGLELAQRLKSQFGDDIVLVAVTGASHDEPLVQQTFVAVDHYFEKPVTLAQIQRIFAPQVSTAPVEFDT
ncbi:MAG: response regulator [Comamonas sp.]